MYLASIRSLITSQRRQNIKIPFLYHVTHKENIPKMMNTFDRTLNFKGHEIVYRTAAPEYSSYMAKPHNIHDYLSWQLIDAKKTITPLTGIKLCHFGTQPPLIKSPLTKKQISRYGNVMYTISYDVMIKRYLQARQKCSKGKEVDTTVVYRVVCTQIYQKEINHMITICCKGDKELDAFPGIDGSANQTKYFIPKETVTQTGMSYSAKMLQNIYKMKRHENLTLSFYLPDECLVSLSQEDYTEEAVEHDPKWCHEIFKSPNFSGQCSSEAIKLT